MLQQSGQVLAGTPVAAIPLQHRPGNRYGGLDSTRGGGSRSQVVAQIGSAGCQFDSLLVSGDGPFEVAKGPTRSRQTGVSTGPCRRGLDDALVRSQSAPEIGFAQAEVGLGPPQDRVVGTCGQKLAICLARSNPAELELHELEI